MAKPARSLRRAGLRSLFLSVRTLAQLCGFHRASAVGNWYGDLVFRLARRRSRRCAVDMARALGRPPGDPWIEQQLRLSHRTHAQAVFEILAMFGRRYDPRELASRVDIEGLEHLSSALGDKRGAILLGTHAGNGVLLAVAVASAGWPVSVVFRQARMMSRDFFERGLALYGVEGIRANDGIRAYARMRDALQRGGIVFVTLDQGVKRSGGGVPVRFLGKDMTVAAGPARLSRRLRAPVLPVTVTGRGDRWRFRIDPPLPHADSVEGDVEQMARAGERQVLLHPELWPWAHRRWSKQPFARATMPAWTQGEDACNTSMNRP